MASIEISFNGQSVSTRSLDKEVMVIGRVEGCDIHIDNLGISRNHARIVRDGVGFRVEDMNSSNGTFVNGEKISVHQLRDGDEIVIGKYHLVFRSSGDAAAQFTPEAAAKAAAQMPDGDALNTMAMDGDVMRKKIMEMRESATNGPNSSIKKPAAEAPHMSSSTAEAELRARQAEEQMIGNRKVMIVGLVVCGLVMIGIAAAIFLLK